MEATGKQAVGRDSWLPTALSLCSTAATLLLHSPYIELKLLALQDVAIGSACLPWTGSDASIQTALQKLVLHVFVNLVAEVASLRGGLGKDCLWLLPQPHYTNALRTLQ